MVNGSEEFAQGRRRAGHGINAMDEGGLEEPNPLSGGHLRERRDDRIRERIDRTQEKGEPIEAVAKKTPRLGAGLETKREGLRREHWGRRKTE